MHSEVKRGVETRRMCPSLPRPPATGAPPPHPTRPQPPALVPQSHIAAQTVVMSAAATQKAASAQL